MGLDITAYRQVSLADNFAKDADGSPVDWDRYFHVYHSPHFPGRAEPLVDGGWYEFEEELSFCTGSYGAYGAWRDALAQLAGYLPHPAAQRHRHAEGAWMAQSGPFWELINFADNEGTIGSVVAAKLATDFAEFEDRAMRSSEPWFYQLYRQWRAAFEMAADDGAVSFH